MTGWVSVHVFSQGSLDDMIIGLAGPLIGDEGFFLRYWEGGPHLRVRVKGLSEGDVVERAQAYLRAHPSRAVIDPEEYARLAETLAAREGMPGYARHLYPNDSAHLIPYQPEHDRYGTGRSLAAVERHFHESSRIALDLLGMGLGPGKRGSAWLTMLLVTWQVGGPGRMFAAPSDAAPRDGVPSDAAPGSAASGDAAPGDAAPGGAGLREGYERERGRLAALAAHVRTITSAPPEPGGVLGGWYASTAHLARELEASGFDGTRTASTLDLAAHLLANRLGIRVQEEARLRYLASRAAREMEVGV